MRLNDLFREMASAAGPDQHPDVVVSDARVDGLEPRSGHAAKTSVALSCAQAEQGRRLSLSRAPLAWHQGASDDKRVTLDCIMVPVNFYESVIRPVFGKDYGVVYVLPEAGSVQAMFGALNAG